MIVNIKYFYEKTDTNYEEYNKIWLENNERFVFLPTNVSFPKQMKSIMNNISDNKDILAIRFPTNRFLKNNEIINNIILGKGFTYDYNKIWYPSEVWIYSVMS